MDPYAQALVMGIVQGLTEFLPISSSGHLILLPSLLGWDDPFIESLAFSVMLHLGTLLALIGYFARDLLGLIPAAIGLVRERRIGDDPERRLVLIELRESAEDEDEPEVEDRSTAEDSLQPKRADEVVCSACFLIVRNSAPNCPVGDEACPIFVR